MRYTVCILYSLILVFVLPLQALAIPAITCHCFTDRSYDPAHPTLADPYFLATTQNSFFSQVFGVEKKAIVMKKQQGTAGDDLWIAYWLAAKGGRSAESLLQAKQGKGSWKGVIPAMGLSPQKLGVRFSAALKNGGADSQLADSIVDELFLHYRLLAEAELKGLRRLGASNQELIIATLIAARTHQSPRQTYLEVKNGASSWGSSLQRSGIEARNMQQELATTLKVRPL